MKNRHDVTVALATLAVLCGTGAVMADEGGTPPAPATISAIPQSSTPAAKGEVLRLTLAEAISRGLEHNLQALLAGQSVEEASGARAIASSALLPQLFAGASQAREKISLDAYGFPVAPGQSPLLGPFNVVDMRLSVTQPIFDLAVVERSRAGGERLTAARSTARDARDAVIAGCAGLYLEAVDGESRVAAAKAQVRTAQALYDRAVDLRSQGMVAGIEVLRAQVELQSEQQRVIVAENTTAKLKLALARAIGAPLDRPLELVDRVPYAPLSVEGVDDAVRQALEHRADVQAAEAETRAAEAEMRAIRDERLPSLIAAGDVGSIGATATGTKETYSLTASLKIPLFEGGRIHGESMVATARVKAAQVRLADLRARVELEVRGAYLDLASAADRVRVGASTVDLANLALEQAKDRFSTGVASNIEVVQAQEAVVAATDGYLSSVLDHNLAKVALARALGLAEATASEMRGGKL
jgi:outer membrane protein TolC